MSLDFSLKSSGKREVTCYHCNSVYLEEDELFSANITHNLGHMAQAVGIYNCLWRPDENNYTIASDAIGVLEHGYADLLARPEYFKAFNSPNGWGTYEHFIEFVRECLEACKNYPDSIISVWR